MFTSISLRTKLLIPLLLGGLVLGAGGAWVAYEASLTQLKDQIVKRAELLGTAINEAAKSAPSDDEIRFAVEEIVRKQSAIYGISVATRDPFVIWASTFHAHDDPNGDVDRMLATLRDSVEKGEFGHFFAEDGDLVSVIPLDLKWEQLTEETAPREGVSRRGVRGAEVVANHGSWVLFTPRKAGTYRGGIYLRFDWTSARQEAGQVFWKPARLTLVAVVLALVLAFWLLNGNVLQPMERMVSAIRRVERGEWDDLHAHSYGGGEFLRLAQAFNRMVDAVQERDHRLRAIIDNLPVAVRLHLPEGERLLRNDRDRHWFGERGEETATDILNQVKARGEVLTREIDAAAGDPHRDYIATAFPVFDRAGGLYAVGEVHTDISELKGKEAQLRRLSEELESRVTERTEELSEANRSLSREVEERRRAEERLRLYGTVIDNTDEAVIITDLTGTIIEVNPAFEQLSGYGREEAVGRDAGFTKSGRHDGDFYREMWRALNGKGRWSGEVWDRRKGGDIYPKWLTINRIASEQGEPLYFIGLFTDIGNQKRIERRLERLAFYDALTALPNRAYFHERLEHEILRCRREEEMLALLFIDLDRFKYVNDTLGHSAGDQLLVEVAERLRGCVRESDTLSRLGGDEFTVILPGVGSSTGAGRIAECIIERVARPVTVSGRTVDIGASIGISVYPQDGEKGEELVRNADGAMYEAKKRGRGIFCYASSETNRHSAEALSLRSELLRALEREEFRLVYQPVVRLTDGVLVGAEALIRWRDAEGRERSPMEFILFAEEAGLIERIGEWTLWEACRRIRAWRDAGLAPPPVAVNVSAVQFRHGGVAEVIARALEACELEVGDLELELTETALMADPEGASATLHALTAMGVRVAIDDFGTGYSSLGYLMEFPVAKVKIDRSFIGRLTTGSNGAVIPTAIIDLCRNLDLPVIAEGVESAEQEAFLKHRQCDFAQGFHFSRPLEADLFVEWIGEGGRREPMGTD